MRKINIIAVIVCVLFLAEFILGNFLGRWFRPNLLILLIIFVDLHLGVRYGVFAAVLGGLLKDSFGAGFFGINIFSFVLCVYVITLLRRNIFYDVEFGFLRILMAFLMSSVNLLIIYALKSLFGYIDFAQALAFVMVPEVLATTVASSLVFTGLKRCVLKLSV